MKVEMAMFLPHRPLPATLDMSERILLWCLRSWLTAVEAGQSPRRALVHGLASIGLDGWAGMVGPFMEAAMRAWGEPLRLQPVGCGCPLSYDECLLIDCVVAAGRGDRVTFDTLLSDMASPSERARLWRTAARLAAADVSPLGRS